MYALICEEEYFKIDPVLHRKPVQRFKKMITLLCACQGSSSCILKELQLCYKCFAVIQSGCNKNMNDFF